MRGSDDPKEGTSLMVALTPSPWAHLNARGIIVPKESGTRRASVGRYINPGNEGFAEILQGRYVDKSGLIRVFDSTLNIAGQKLVMVSRPRRFGKSYAAQALAAFYSRGCDSRQLFENLEVARQKGWDAHLNQLNVIKLDMTGVIELAGSVDVVPTLREVLLAELRQMTPNAGTRHVGEGSPLKDALWDTVQATGRKFVFIIDEWDALYRLAQADKDAQDAYAERLRALFKDLTFTPEVVAGAYMTGILPIKKYNHQSAVSDFREYTMVAPVAYAPYVGFTEGEVEGLCEEYGMDLAEVRHWYDGYDLRGVGETYSIFAPYSLMRACEAHTTGSYWPSTEAFELISSYIEMNFDGLQDDLVRAIGGVSIKVDPDGFQNDMVTMTSRDDVLTLLVHLGYLTYDAHTRTARVPNDEVRAELARTVGRSRHPKLVGLMRESARLLDAMVAMDESAVAVGFARVHDRDTTPLFYNNEQALRAVVKSALVAAVDDYARIEELPGGKGFADVAYLPARGALRPAIVVELKWNRPVDVALEQARERRYAEVVDGLDVPVLLVGVSYDPKTREHTCRIELQEA